MIAQSAFWVGLLYDHNALDAAWDLVKGWTTAERQQLRDDVPRLALDATIRGRKLADVAREVLALSRAGLEARNHRDAMGRTEAHFLEPVEAIAASGRTLADTMIARFQEQWNGDVRPVFRDMAY